MSAIKFAGKDNNGLARGIRVTNEGALLPEEGGDIIFAGDVNLPPGTQGPVGFFYTSSPFRVLFFPETASVGAPWEVTLDERVRIGTEFFNSTPRVRPVRTVLESSGDRNVVIGEGERSRGVSHIQKPLGNAFEARVINKSAGTNLVGRLVVVRYSRYENNESPEYPEVIIVGSSEAETLSGIKVLYESTSYTRMESLEFASTSVDLPWLRIVPLSGINQAHQALGIATPTGGFPMTMEGIDLHSSSLFDLHYRGVSGSKYSLNRYMTFPRGVRIEIEWNKPEGEAFALRGYAIRRGGKVDDYFG